MFNSVKIEEFTFHCPLVVYTFDEYGLVSTGGKQHLFVHLISLLFAEDGCIFELFEQLVYWWRE